MDGKNSGFVPLAERVANQYPAHLRDGVNAWSEAVRSLVAFACLFVSSLLLLMSDFHEPSRGEGSAKPQKALLLPTSQPINVHAFRPRLVFFLPLSLLKSHS